jgi:hypothetical protein
MINPTEILEIIEGLLNRGYGRNNEELDFHLSVLDHYIAIGGGEPDWTVAPKARGLYGR